MNNKKSQIISITFSVIITLIAMELFRAISRHDNQAILVYSLLIVLSLIVSLFILRKIQ